MSATVLVLFLMGLVLLVVGAEALVRGASRLALALGISPLVVGLTVVAFGTSSPEMAVSVQSASSGAVDIAVGNVVGSNIFNVLFILGLSAALVPLIVNQQLIRLEVPIMIAVSLLLYGLAWDGAISRGEGWLLFAGIVLYTVFQMWQSRRATKALQAEYEQEFGVRPGGARAWAVNIGLVVAGLAMLVLGSRWLVQGAVALAEWLGLSELVIGLTIVAAGTSLPEVATSAIATLRGERDIAVGNAVGSNIFNILAVLGLAAIVAPEALPVPVASLRFDIPFMVAVALACLPIFFTGATIARWEGWLFLFYYVAYTAYLVLASVQHDSLPAFSAVMSLFVVPITVLTIGLIALRELRRSRQPEAGA